MQVNNKSQFPRIKKIMIGFTDFRQTHVSVVSLYFSSYRWFSLSVNIYVDEPFRQGFYVIIVIN